jgi:hypothetical protein
VIVREILSDLVAEQQFLDQYLQRISLKDWDRPTPAKGWTIRDTISHLADYEELASQVIAGTADLSRYRSAPDLDALRQEASCGDATCGPRTSSNGGGAVGRQWSSRSRT